jgi:hypothetical protein
MRRDIFQYQDQEISVSKARLTNELMRRALNRGTLKTAAGFFPMCEITHVTFSLDEVTEAYRKLPARYNPK